MLAPGIITFLTVFGGIALALLVYGASGFYLRQWRMPFTTILAIVANSMVLVTISCLLVNVGVTIVAKSQLFDAFASVGQPEIHTTMQFDGNEATVFLAFLYAFVVIGAAVYRNINEIKQD